MVLTNHFRTCRDKFVLRIPRLFAITLQGVATGTKPFSLPNNYFFVDHNKNNILIPVKRQVEFLNV